MFDLSYEFDKQSINFEVVIFYLFIIFELTILNFRAEHAK